MDSLFNTGAFMTNLLLRYAPNGGCGLQPYLLGGLGGWWGETGGDVELRTDETTRRLGSRDNGGFAFQVGAGVDYYFEPRWSVFTEYKFLDYTNAGGEFNHSNIGQHLVGAALDFIFKRRSCCALEGGSAFERATLPRTASRSSMQTC